MPLWKSVVFGFQGSAGSPSSASLSLGTLIPSCIKAYYKRIIGKIKDKLLHWREGALSLFDKIRIWNTFLGSLLSYTDQLSDLPEEERNTLLQTMQKFLGGPHGWLPARTACSLKADCNFPVAPRDPGPNNLAAQCRVRINLPESIKTQIALLRGYNPGYNEYSFPYSPALCIRDVDHKLRLLRLSRQTIKLRATHRDAHGVETQKSYSNMRTTYVDFVGILPAKLRQTKPARRGYKIEYAHMSQVTIGVTPGTGTLLQTAL